MLHQSSQELTLSHIDLPAEVSRHRRLFLLMKGEFLYFDFFYQKVRSRETFAVVGKSDGHLAQRFIILFLMYGPSDHPCIAFPASISCLLICSIFISTLRDKVIESATTRASIKNGKQPCMKIMITNVIAGFISRSRINEDRVNRTVLEKATLEMLKYQKPKLPGINQDEPSSLEASSMVKN